MTRPQIIRADTLDLQDKTSPTAQDHSRQPQHPSPLGVGPAAPHQEASLRQVDDERSSEEQHLQSQPSFTETNTLRDDPGSDDERTIVNSINGEDSTQQDEQAVRLNGGNTGSADDGDMADAEVDDLDDDMMDKISSSPSIDDEDIDFEFVYALHTFVATVEGQANATKGDTMVLLDDSNSYWWLVRVVKDSSIGYLPAEHIETPTERLARLNKHRNIDLSATMLGDTAEKTKNPLKKAMRRRNAKTVQFAAPTYVEASEYEYSSDEENEQEEGLVARAGQSQVEVDSSNEKSEAEQDEGLKVQPLKVGAKKESKQNPTDEEDSKEATEDTSKPNGDKARTSDEIFDRPLDPKVSRNGTLRNTDSFFKDDNAETRKITLTPNLLRDDSSTSTTGSRERGPSLESLEKNGFADKVKEDKKKKEKKPGMLSGLFKRKEKKPKANGALDSFDSDAEKQSQEFGRESPQAKMSEDLAERPSNDQTGNQSPQRQSSKGKLQKPQRSRDTSPSKTKASSPPEISSPEPTAVQAPASKEKEAVNGKPPGSQHSTMRLVSPEQEEDTKSSVEAKPTDSVQRSRSNSAASKLNPMNMLSRPKAEPGEARPEKVKKAKQRVQLDDFDSEDEKNDPFADANVAQKKTQQLEEKDTSGRLSESPVQISAADAQPLEKEVSKDQEPPGLTGDSSSQETPSPISTPSPTESPSTNVPSKPTIGASRGASSPSPTSLTSPSSIPPPNRPAPIPTKDMETSPPGSSNSTSLPAWSDASLRSYLEDGSEIRDMLTVIHDTNGVTPVGPEHPIMAGMFVEERKTMTQLGGQLDGLLGEWLERKRKRGQGLPRPVR